MGKVETTTTRQGITSSREFKKSYFRADCDTTMQGSSSKLGLGVLLRDSLIFGLATPGFEPANFQVPDNHS